MSKHIGIAPVPAGSDSWGGSTSNPYPGAGNELFTPSTSTLRTATGTFTAGSNTTSLRIDIWAPAGSDTTSSGGSYGLGGYVSGIISVSPGETIWLNFNSDGGQGGSIDNYAGGYTALGIGSTVYHPYSTTLNWYTSPATVGGAGGGSVDVRQGSNDISRIMLVAGGGGGQGGEGANAGTTSEANAVANASVGGYGGAGGSMYSNNGQTGQGNQASGAGLGPAVNTGVANGGGGGQNTTGGAAGANSPKVVSAGPPGAGRAAFGNPPHNGGNGGYGSQAAWPGGGGGGGGGGYTGGGGGGGGGGDYYNFSIARPMISSGAAGGGGAGGTSYVDTSVTGVRMLPGCYSPTAGTVVLTPNPPVVSDVNWPASVVDLAAGAVALDWTFTQHGTATQAKYAICRQVLGGLTHQWWNASSTSWVPSELFNTGTPSVHTFNSGDWNNGASWQVSVAVIDSNGSVSGYTSAPVVQAQTGPSVTITSPSSGGTVTTANPTLTWSEVLAPNCNQVSYQVFVINSGGGYAYQSGVVYSQATTISLSSLATPPYLPNGTYTFEVIVSQTGGQVAVASESFTVNQPAITAPTGVIYGSSPTDTPAVTCTLQNFVAGAVDSLIQRNVNGAGWVTIRNYVTFAGASTQTIVDYEAPTNTPIMYRAAVQTGNAQSAWHNFVNVLTLKPVWFTLSDPLNPGSAIPVSLTAGTLTETGGERQASYNLLGVTTPVILADTLQAVTLNMNLMFFTDAAYQTYKAMRATQHVLLFQAATWTQQWYIRLGTSETVNLDLASGRAGRNGPATPSPFLHRDVQISAQVVAAP